MKTIAEIRRANLDLLAQEFGTIDLVAARSGTSPVYLSQIKHQAIDAKTGKTREMGTVVARKLDKGCGKMPGWMDTDHSAPNVSLAPVGGRKIPLISSIQAGDFKEVVDSFEPGGGSEYLLTDLDLSNYAFALEIEGNSMLPEFNEGDRVIIDPDVRPLPGDFVAAKNGSNEATFKKYRPRGIGANGQEVFELVPLNEDYPSIRSEVTPVVIIGTMVEHRKYRRRR